jgi:hypothetical protein
MARSMSNRSKTNQNLQMFKKNAFPNLTPRQTENRESTTYNYTYREPIPNLSSFNNNSTNSFNFGNNQEHIQRNNFQSNSVGSAPAPVSMPSHQFPHSSPPHSNTAGLDFTPKLQQEAEMRVLNRSHTNTAEPLRPKGYMELNRLTNKLFNDNQPTNEYPNHSYWFGRAGQHKTAIGTFNQTNDQYSADPRRRKLLDSLENRSPRDIPKIYGIDNSNLPKNTQLAFVNDPHSNHRNMYENNPTNMY